MPYVPDAASQNNPNQVFTNMPVPPLAPEIEIRDNYRSNIENGFHILLTWAIGLLIRQTVSLQLAKKL